MDFDSRLRGIPPNEMAKEARVEIHTDLPIEPCQEVDVELGSNALRVVVNSKQCMKRFMLARYEVQIP